MKNREPLSPNRAAYCARLNRVIDYIDNHLDEELTLDILSDACSFSKFHFHRIFTAFTGETPGAYIQRLRLERAAGKLIGAPDLPITAAALDAGFSSSSVFSRAFRERFGVSPSAWRRGERVESGKQRNAPSNPCTSSSSQGKEDLEVIRYCDYRNQLWRIIMNHGNGLKFTVQVKDLPACEAAYIRHTGPYAGNTELFARLFGTIMRWAGSRGLLQQPDFRTLTIYHDSPEITDEEKLRISVCVTVPPGTETDGEIGRTVIPAGRYAVGTFEIAADQYGQAWDCMMNTWLPDSGWQCSDHGPCYEVNLNDPNDHPEGKHQIEIHLPVIPL